MPQLGSKVVTDAGNVAIVIAASSLCVAADVLFAPLPQPVNVVGVFPV